MFIHRNMAKQNTWDRYQLFMDIACVRRWLESCTSYLVMVDVSLLSYHMKPNHPDQVLSIMTMADYLTMVHSHTSFCIFTQRWFIRIIPHSSEYMEMFWGTTQMAQWSANITYVAVEAEQLGLVTIGPQEEVRILAGFGLQPVVPLHWSSQTTAPVHHQGRLLSSQHKCTSRCAANYSNSSIRNFDIMNYGL